MKTNVFVVLCALMMVFAMPSAHAFKIPFFGSDDKPSLKDEPPVDDIIFMPIRELPTSKMRDIVERAALTREWIPTVKSKNCVQCKLRIRKHEVVIDVIIEEKRLVIRYVSSVNMDVNPAKRTIHKKYRGWIDNLTREVDKLAATAK